MRYRYRDPQGRFTTRAKWAAGKKRSNARKWRRESLKPAKVRKPTPATPRPPGGIHELPRPVPAPELPAIPAPIREPQTYEEWAALVADPAATAAHGIEVVEEEIMIRQSYRAAGADAVDIEISAVAIWPKSMPPGFKRRYIEEALQAKAGSATGLWTRDRVINPSAGRDTPGITFTEVNWRNPNRK